MRGLRSTIILFVALVALGAYIYFVESKRPTSQEAAEKKDKVFTVESDKIDELTVKGTKGETTTLKRTGDSWEMVAPEQVKGDQSEASGIATNLSTLEIQRVVDEDGKNLAQYGLQPPRIEVAFRVAGEKEPRRIHFGQKTATGGDLYARMPNSNRVFLIPAYLEQTFDKTTFDLQDKTLLAFERDKTDSLEIAAGDKTLKVVKSGSDWRLEQPIHARGDYGAVEGLLGRIATAQVKTIAAPKMEDPSKYGFDKPGATVTVGAGSSRAILLLGSAADEGNIYARDTARPAVYTVESGLLDELKKDPTDYRRKDVFEFRPFNANYVEIARGPDIRRFGRSKGTGGDATEKWRQTGPVAQDIDTAKFEDFLSKLANMRVQSFADGSTKTGLDAPAATVTVRYEEEKKVEKVSFGRVDSDVYASIPGEPGAAKIDAGEFDAALKLLDELKPAAPEQTSAPEKK